MTYTYQSTYCRFSPHQAHIDIDYRVVFTNMQIPPRHLNEHACRKHYVYLFLNRILIHATVSHPQRVTFFFRWLFVYCFVHKENIKDTREIIVMFYTSVSRCLARVTFGSLVTKPHPLEKRKLVPVGTGRHVKAERKENARLSHFGCLISIKVYDAFSCGLHQICIRFFSSIVV